MVSYRDGNAQKIYALDEQAAALGLRTGLGIADARAMFPATDVVEQDIEADRRLLEALADWCDRYTPLVSIEGSEGLFLDITGCAHLFGGERAMRDQVLSSFYHQGFSVFSGMASTPGMAWALARDTAGTGVAEPGEEERLLGPMPLAALRIEPVTRASLESVGLRTVASVLAAPRAPLARRFGQQLLLRIDQALGQVDEAISPRQPVPPLSVERAFPDPIIQMEDIEALVPVLGAALRRDLERAGEGARRLDLLLFRVDGHVHRISIGASRPIRDPRLMQRLFRERLAAVGQNLDAGFGFDLIRLAASMVARFENTQADLSDGPAGKSGDISLLADRTTARLGRNVLCVSAPYASHLPERAVVIRPLTDQLTPPFDRSSSPELSKAPDRSKDRKIERPIRLFDPPEAIDVMAAQVPEGPPSRFRWRRIAYTVTHAEGPERISPEWWQERWIPPEPDKKDAPAKQKKAKEEQPSQTAFMHLQTLSRTRDYFRIEDAAGRRYWLYREGLYGGAVPPRWYMHGLFA